MKNHCINVTDCLIVFDVMDDIMYFCVLTRIMFNQKSNSTYPIASIILTSIVMLQSRIIGYMKNISINSNYVNESSSSYLNITSLYVVTVNFSIINGIIYLTNASIRNETSHTIPPNGDALFDIFSLISLGWINSNSNIVEDITYNCIHQDYNTLLKNGFDKIMSVESIVLVVILHEYTLLTCLMISMIINSSNTSISDDDGSIDTLSRGCTISDIENIIHVQVQLLTKYISVVERKINDATDAASILSILTEIVAVLIEFKLINGAYTYNYDSSLIVYLLEFVTDDIISVCPDKVVAKNLTYSLDEEVEQLPFDTFKNVAEICIYSNENTSLSTTNGQLIIDTNTTIAQLLITDANNVFLDYMVMITKGSLCVFSISSTEMVSKKLQRKFISVTITTLEWIAAEPESPDNSEYNIEYLSICQSNQIEIFIFINTVIMNLNYLTIYDDKLINRSQYIIRNLRSG